MLQNVCRFDTILGPNWNSKTNSALGQDKTMKRDIACFPTSTPMTMSPAIMHRSESDKNRPESTEDLKQYGSSNNQKLPPLNPVGIVKGATESEDSFYKLPNIRKDSFPDWWYLNLCYSAMTTFWKLTEKKSSYFRVKFVELSIYFSLLQVFFAWALSSAKEKILTCINLALLPVPSDFKKQNLWNVKKFSYG